MIDILSLTGPSAEAVRMSQLSAHTEQPESLSGPTFREVLEKQTELSETRRTSAGQQEESRTQQARERDGKVHGPEAQEDGNRAGIGDPKARNAGKAGEAGRKTEANQNPSSSGKEKSEAMGKLSGGSKNPSPDAAAVSGRLSGAGSLGSFSKSVAPGDSRTVKTGKAKNPAEKETEGQIEASVPKDSEKPGSGREAETFSGLENAAGVHGQKLQAKSGGIKGEGAGAKERTFAAEKNQGASELQKDRGAGSGIELTLIDRRTEKKSIEKPERKKGSEESLELKKEAVSGFSEKSIGGDDSAGNKNIRIIELNPSADSRALRNPMLDGHKGQGAESSFQRLLRDEGVPRIVKQSGILLKDNNQGEIKLILHPESLGKVRINLNLQENHIAGRIIVENSNVKDAFNGTLDDLTRALRDSGFHTAHLEVSVEGQNQEGFQERQGRQAQIHRGVMAVLEESVPNVESFYNQDVLVNLLA